MNDIVKRLRGRRPFARHDPEGELKLITEAADEIERLRKLLKPFADAVSNDNGDMTISFAPFDAYADAYFGFKEPS